MKSNNLGSTSGKLNMINSNKSSTHPENLGESPPVGKKLHPFDMMIIPANIQINTHSRMARLLLGHLPRHGTRILKFCHLGIHTTLLDTVE
jgi:hypothetical protein